MTFTQFDKQPILYVYLHICIVNTFYTSWKHRYLDVNRRWQQIIISINDLKHYWTSQPLDGDFHMSINTTDTNTNEQLRNPCKDQFLLL